MSDRVDNFQWPGAIFISFSLKWFYFRCTRITEPGGRVTQAAQQIPTLAGGTTPQPVPVMGWVKWGVGCPGNPGKPPRTRILPTSPRGSQLTWNGHWHPKAIPRKRLQGITTQFRVMALHKTNELAPPRTDYTESTNDSV